MRVLLVSPVAVGLCLLVGLAAGTVPLSPARSGTASGAANSSASRHRARPARAARPARVLRRRQPRRVRGGAPGHDPESAGRALPARALRRCGARRRDRHRHPGRRGRGRCRSPHSSVRSAAVALVYRLSLVAGRRLDPRVLLLSGVVVGSFAGALMSAIIVLSPAAGDPQRLSLAARRVSVRRPGSRWASSSAYAVLPLGVIGLRAREASTSSALGEEPAHHLGADVHRTRRVVYACTALLTAASVATCGIIGFVGLVVPHAVRIGRAAAAPLAPAARLRGRRRRSWCCPTSSPERWCARWSCRSASSPRSWACRSSPCCSAGRSRDPRGGATSPCATRPPRAPRSTA